MSEQLKFTTNIGNSLVVAEGTTLFGTGTSASGAFGIVRFFPCFSRALTRALITTCMFPLILLAVPYSIIIALTGLANSHIRLIVVYISRTSQDSQDTFEY
ncbi:MAG: hypothetical protein GX123_06105 [Clostridiales bacterium]|nr:hypothetical protein [Clostridiales bacterium]